MYPSPDRNPILGDKTYTCVEQDTLDYIARAGALPIMIPKIPSELLSEFLSGLDGLVLQGGSDIAPESYGEEPIGEGKWKGDAPRDAFELEVVEKCMALDLPILGICRGFQLLNVHFGGKLYQDIPTQFPSETAHRNIARYDRHAHEIEFVPGGLLEKLHADESVRMVNSIHHQGVKVLGYGLRKEATSPDGLVEAFVWEGADDGRVMGIQWHPEFFIHSDTPLISPDRILHHWLSFCG